MNYIFSFMIVFSLIYAFMSGNIEQTVEAAFSSAGDSVTMVLSFAGIMCMWTGFLKVAKEGGAILWLSERIYPITKRLFPKLDKNSKAMENISANISANLLGVGNAATPSGIAAMEELDKINKNPHYASDEMSIFTLINTASIQVVPTTVIALRAAQGSKHPQEIIGAVIITSVISLLCALSLMKIILFLRKKLSNRKRSL